MDASSVKEADLREVVQPSKPKVVEGTGNPMLDQAFLGVEESINRIQNETNDIYQRV